MKCELDIHVVIRSVDEAGRHLSHGLEVRQQHTIATRTFLEVARILGRFHELGEAIAREDTPHA